MSQQPSFDCPHLKRCGEYHLLPRPLRPEPGHLLPGVVLRQHDALAPLEELGNSGCIIEQKKVMSASGLP